MGRWAQRRLAGGGVNPLNYVISARQLDDTHAEITFQYDTDLDLVDNMGIESSPSGAQKDSLTQVDRRTYGIEWDMSTAGDNEVQMNYSTPGFIASNQIQYD